MPEEFVYEVCKVIYENVDLVKLSWPQMARGMALENAGFTTAPYHPGTVRYFREQGAQIPDELIPPEMK